MVIKVLGKDTSIVKKITCRNCGSILEYYNVDVKSHVGRDYGGGIDILKYIVCPECNKEVAVSHT